MRKQQVYAADQHISLCEKMSLSALSLWLSTLAGESLCGLFPLRCRKGEVCQSFDEMLREGRGGGVLQVRPRQKELWFLLRVGAAGRVGLSRRAARAAVTLCVTPVPRIKVAINNTWLNVETVIILISCTWYWICTSNVKRAASSARQNSRPAAHYEYQRKPFISRFQQCVARQKSTLCTARWQMTILPNQMWNVKFLKRNDIFLKSLCLCSQIISGGGFLYDN